MKGHRDRCFISFGKCQTMGIVGWRGTRRIGQHKESVLVESAKGCVTAVIFHWSQLKWQRIIRSER